MPTLSEYQRYISYANQVEKQYGLPENILVGVMDTESKFNYKAVSKAGAQGLMQFMPATSKEFKINPFNPTESINAAGKYLNQLYKQTGNWEDALMAYNWGIGNIKKWKEGKKTLPQETAQYVGKVYKSANIKKQPSPIADEAIRQANTYFEELPTNDVKDLPNTEEIVNFTTEEEVEDKDIQEVKQQTKEYNFLEEYKALVNQQQPIQEEQEISQEQQIPQQNLTDIYNEVSQFIDTPIAQQGKTVRDNIPNLQPKLPIESSGLSPQAYLESYLQTPVYLERLKNQKYPKPEEVVQYRLDRLKDVDIYYQDPNDNYIQEAYRSFRGFENRNGLGSAYSPRTNKITINQAADTENLLSKNFKVDPKSVEAHELSHVTTSTLPLNNKDEIELFRRLKDFQTDEDFRPQDKEDMIKNKTYNRLSHDFLPSENKADIDALRYELYKKNIYDTRKDGKFNKDHLKQIRDNDFIKSRLQDNYTDEDIIWLMNNIADAYKSDNTGYAQEGISIGNLTPSQSTDVENQRKWLNNWNENRVVEGKRINKNSDIPFSTDIYIDDLNYNSDGKEITLGEFDNVSDRLTLDKNYQSQKGVPVHEFSHRYQKYLEPSTYNKYINEPISTALQNTQGSNEYHGNVDENQAELNRLRYNSGFKPDQVITPQDLQKYNSDDYNLKHFSQEQLIDVLNKTAYNENNSNLRYAQQGISLNTSFNGLPLMNTTNEKKVDIRKPSDLVRVKSSLNEGEVNYVRTTKPTDKPLKREKLVEQQASDDFVSWFSDPATKEKFTKNTGLDANRLQDFIGKGVRTPMREAQQHKDIEYLSKLGADAVYQSPYVKKANNDDVNSKTGEILYQKQRESTSYSKAPNMRNVLGHEIIHGSSLDGVLGGALQRVLGDVNNQTKGTFRRDREYLAHPEETYGNFHMFRKNLGLTPGQKIDEAQLKKLVKEKGLDEEIFYKAYDDDKIVKAINTIADNSQEQDNIYAQTGGKAIKDNNGYWNPNNWGKAVEISSPHITMKGVKEPLIGISNQTGERKLMLPEKEYKFNNTEQVTEHPLTENEKEFLKYIANKK